jgi:hypothetical protein
MLGFSWGAWVMARTRNEDVHKDERQVSQDCSLHLPSACDGLLKASSTSSRGQQKTKRDMQQRIFVSGHPPSYKSAGTLLD